MAAEGHASHAHLLRLGRAARVLLRSVLDGIHAARVGMCTHLGMCWPHICCCGHLYRYGKVKLVGMPGLQCCKAHTCWSQEQTARLLTALDSVVAGARLSLAGRTQPSG